MSLDKFVARGFTASTGGGLDTWIAKSSPSASPGPTSQSAGSGTSFVMGGSPGSRAGSSRVGEAFGGRNSSRHSNSGLARSGEGKSALSEHDRLSFSEDLIVSLFPQFNPRLVLAVLVVLGLSAVGYLFMQVAGLGHDPDRESYGHAVQSEIAERRSRFR